MFIQTEPTPNPDTVKFLPGQEVAGMRGPFDFPDAESARISLLARALFQVDGVERVFLGGDFVSISKVGDKDWRHVKPMVMAAIMDHYMAGLPVIEEGGEVIRHRLHFPSLLYYSLVTLTTLGYGDITPLTPFSRTLASMQAVFGQVYLAVLVARLVGMHIAHTSRPMRG